MTRARPVTPMKTVLLGALAYALVTFPLAYVWHLVAFADIYDRLNAFTRSEPIVPLGFLAIVLQGVLLSAAYPLLRPACCSGAARCWHSRRSTR